MSAREPIRIPAEVAAHAIAADAARAAGFNGLAGAHAKLARFYVENCACGEMRASRCPGPESGRCYLAAE